VLHRPEHIALSEQIAAESVILLKNDRQLLPFDKTKIKTIAVIGPNANQVQYGDYSYTRDNTSGITVLQGLQQAVAPDTRILYARGCSLTGSDSSGFAEALEKAHQSDLIVAVLGETAPVLSGLGWGKGQGGNEPGDPFLSGEGYDVTSLDPPGMQRALVKALYRTGKPVVLVLIHGRPWSIGWEKEHLPALIEAWYPGERGGLAIAKILTGETNPSGRLTVSIPKSAGHIPVYYNYKPSSRGYYHEPGTPDRPGRDYVFSSPDPLFPFGYGLSYTKFAYTKLKVSPKRFTKNDRVEINVNVANVGRRAGKEVVQLYIRDLISSVTTPVLALKGFDKIDLEPGETKTVHFTLRADDLGLWNESMQFVTEPGWFEIGVGRSAEEIELSDRIQYVGKQQTRITLH